MGEAVWLQLGESEMKCKEEQLRRCLVGWFREVAEPFPDLSLVQSAVTRLWSLKGGVKIYVFGGFLLLLDFELSLEAKRVVSRGSRRCLDKVLHLVRWTPKVGCLLEGGSPKEVWVRVLGLPLHLWSREVLQKIGDGCGGFVALDDDIAMLSHLQSARILVRSCGRVKPGSLQVVVGASSFSIQLWWEVPPSFSMLVPRYNNNGDCGLEEGENVEGGPHASKRVGKKG